MSHQTLEQALVHATKVYRKDCKVFQMFADRTYRVIASDFDHWKKYGDEVAAITYAPTITFTANPERPRAPPQRS